MPLPPRISHRLALLCLLLALLAAPRGAFAENLQPFQLRLDPGRAGHPFGSRGGIDEESPLQGLGLSEWAGSGGSYTSVEGEYYDGNAMGYLLMDRVDGSQLPLTLTLGGEVAVMTPGAWQYGAGVPTQYFLIPIERAQDSLLLMQGNHASHVANVTPFTGQVFHSDFGRTSAQIAEASAVFDPGQDFWLVDVSTRERSIANQTNLLSWQVNTAAVPLVEIQIWLDPAESGNLFTLQSRAAGGVEHLQSLQPATGAGDGLWLYGAGGQVVYTPYDASRITALIGKGTEFWLTRDADGAESPHFWHTDEGLENFDGVANSYPAIWSVAGLFTPLPPPQVRIEIRVPLPAADWTVVCGRSSMDPEPTYFPITVDSIGTLSSYDDFGTYNGIDYAVGHIDVPFFLTSFRLRNGWTYGSFDGTNAVTFTPTHPQPPSVSPQQLDLTIFSGRKNHTFSVRQRDPSGGETTVFSFAPLEMMANGTVLPPGEWGTANLTNDFGAQIPVTVGGYRAYPLFGSLPDGTQPSLHEVFTLTVARDVNRPFWIVDETTGETAPLGQSSLGQWYPEPSEKPLTISSSRWGHDLWLCQPDGENFPIQQLMTVGDFSSTPSHHAWFNSYYYFDGTAQWHDFLDWWVEDRTTGEMTDQASWLAETSQSLDTFLIGWAAVYTPRALQAIAGFAEGTSWVDLTWKRGEESPEGGYLLERWSASEADWQALEPNPIAASSADASGIIHVVDDNVVPDQTYYYRLHYRFGDTTSGPSEIVGATPGFDEDTENGYNLRAEIDDSAPSIELIWNDGTHGEEPGFYGGYFQIERSNSSGNWSVLGTTDSMFASGAYHFIDTDISADTPYLYRLRFLSFDSRSWPASGALLAIARSPTEGSIPGEGSSGVGSRFYHGNGGIGDWCWDEWLATHNNQYLGRSGIVSPGPGGETGLPGGMASLILRPVGAWEASFGFEGFRQSATGASHPTYLWANEAYQRAGVATLQSYGDVSESNQNVVFGARGSYEGKASGPIPGAWPSGNAPCTCFVVGRLTSPNGSLSVGLLNTSVGVNIGPARIGGRQGNFVVPQGAGAHLISPYAPAHSVQIGNPNQIASGEEFIAEVSFDGTSMKTACNGVPEFISTPQSDSVAKFRSASPRGTTGGLGVGGSHSEVSIVLVYNRVLDDLERKQILSYLIAHSGRHTLVSEHLQQDTDGDGLPNWKENEIGTNAGLADVDGDGVSDGFEILHMGTNPKNWDSDGDLIPDGLDTKPLASNSGEDPDLDGLTNFEEMIYCTDPNKWDTDGDGFSDGEEVRVGAIPTDPNDHPIYINPATGLPSNPPPHNPNSPQPRPPLPPGSTHPPEGAVNVALSIGDPSSSQSERWAMQVRRKIDGKLILNFQGGSFGSVTNEMFSLFRKGSTYTISLDHIATKALATTDYDWMAKVNVDEQWASVLRDVDHLLEENVSPGPTTTNRALGKVAELNIPILDIIFVDDDGSQLITAPLWYFNEAKPKNYPCSRKLKAQALISNYPWTEFPTTWTWSIVQGGSHFKQEPNSTADTLLVTSTGISLAQGDCEVKATSAEGWEIRKKFTIEYLNSLDRPFSVKTIKPGGIDQARIWRTLVEYHVTAHFGSVVERPLEYREKFSNHQNYDSNWQLPEEGQGYLLQVPLAVDIIEPSRENAIIGGDLHPVPIFNNNYNDNGQYPRCDDYTGAWYFGSFDESGMRVLNKKWVRYQNRGDHENLPKP